MTADSHHCCGQLSQPPPVKLCDRLLEPRPFECFPPRPRVFVVIDIGSVMVRISCDGIRSAKLARAHLRGDGRKIGAHRSDEIRPPARKWTRFLTFSYFWARAVWLLLSSSRYNFMRCPRLPCTTAIGKPSQQDL